MSGGGILLESQAYQDVYILHTPLEAFQRLVPDICATGQGSLRH